MLEIQNLSLTLPGRTEAIFKIQNIQVKEKDRLVLTGSSGIGKTLFLRSVCLLESRATGNIYWRSRKILDREVPFYRAQVLYIGQKSVCSFGKVQSFFEESFRYKTHQNKRWDIDETQKILHSLGKDRDFLQKSLQDLSGGEKQIVHVLRALALKPSLLCLDEPTSALDVDTTCKLEKWLMENYFGAWIWVTHDLAQAQRVGNARLKFI